MSINETIQNHSTKIKNTVNTSTHITRTPTQLSKHPHITKPTHTHTHTLQNKLTTVQDTHQMKQLKYNQINSV